MFDHEVEPQRVHQLVFRLKQAFSVVLELLNFQRAGMGGQGGGSRGGGGGGSQLCPFKDRLKRPKDNSASKLHNSLSAASGSNRVGGINERKIIGEQLFSGGEKVKRGEAPRHKTTRQSPTGNENKNVELNFLFTFRVLKSNDNLPHQRKMLHKKKNTHTHTHLTLNGTIC